MQFLATRSIRAALCGPVIAAWAALSASSPAAASGLQISPTRVDLDAEQPIAALHLKNGSDREIAFEIELAEWSQSGGSDQFEPTPDLLVSPPVFILPAGEEQVIRVGLANRAITDGIESSYRLFIQELPDEEAASVNGLRMLVRLSLPVFVRPAEFEPRPALQWRLERSSDRATELVVTNAGNGHAKVTDLTIKNAGDASIRSDMFYVLPGATRRIPLDGPVPASEAARVEARVNGHPIEAQPRAD
ncbi:fimbrial biogenesis chaperone [Halomonas denitrificans]|nr:molecular chaperone [Halomonas denitrificans]